MRPSISPDEKPRRSSMTCAAITSLTTGACARAPWVVKKETQQSNKKRFIHRQAASYPPEVGPVFSLSIHADYQCQHSGVCCTSDWDIPVEVPVFRSLDEAMAAGRLAAAATPADGTPVLIQDDLPDDAAA